MTFRSPAGQYARNEGRVHAQADLPPDRVANEKTTPDGLSLYGRKLWDTMGPYWGPLEIDQDTPAVEADFARRWRARPKVVFSSTLAEADVDWNTRVYAGDPVPEIKRLKGEEGGSMEIGGATLAGAAIRAGLVDEYSLYFSPIAIGGGTPYFRDLDSWVELKLLDTRTFDNGVVLLRYEKRR
jgi:dihydrofolate reductase